MTPEMLRQLHKKHAARTRQVLDAHKKPKSVTTSFLKEETDNNQTPTLKLLSRVKIQVQWNPPFSF